MLGNWQKQPGVKREPNYILEPTLNSQAKDRPPHPTPKPLTVIHHLLKHTPQNAHITDPFLGSGQTLLACAQTNRTATGIEIDESYCELAATRIEQFLSQERLI